MYKSYFKLAFRRVLRDRSYSVINIFGLAAGLACFAFIALWVNDELGFDKFNEHYDRIVRVVEQKKTSTGIEESARTSAPMASALKDDYPEVEYPVRLRVKEELILRGQEQLLQSGILITDPSFFNVFSYKLSRGDKKTALNDPFSVVLTESTAKKYFGDTDPLNRTMVIFMNDSTGHGANYKVTGITADPPENVHFGFTMLVSFSTVEKTHPDILAANAWGDANFYTYLLLKPGVKVEAFSKKIARFYEKYIGEERDTWRSTYSFTLQPLKNIHLRSNLRNEIGVTGNINQVYIFSLIGVVILLLAGINYTNLSIARSAGRAREVGIKKIVGIRKSQLIFQYLSESVMIAFMALVFSLLLVMLVQPWFARLTEKDISLFASPLLLLFLLGVSLFLGILAGMYPAFVLSAFKPIAVLKGAFKSTSAGIFLRKSLVITQFVITLILVTGIVIIYSQMDYIKSKDLGYDKDALLTIGVNGNNDVIDGFNAFKDDLTRSPLITGITRSNSLIINGLSGGTGETLDGKGEPVQLNVAMLKADQNYLSVYQIRILAGQNFSANESSPKGHFILNETAVKKAGWPNPGSAVGKPFKVGDKDGTIIAVTNDFHFNTLQRSIEPLVIYPMDDHFSRITLKVDLARLNQSIALVEQVWKKHFPGALYDFDFIDQQIKRQYFHEEQFSKIFLYFSVLSLLIACLGLYGLTAYETFQKTKEIGIRKVLGASANGIALMLSRGLLQLVIFAGLLAVPVAWLLMHKWLQNFAYRINLSWWMFCSPLVFVSTIALITVSFHTIKAALTNPVKSLRVQ